MGMLSEVAAQQPAATGLQAVAPSDSGQLRPVPKAGFSSANRTASQPQHQSRDLSWRKSTIIEASPRATSLQLKRTSPAAQHQSAIQQVSGESSITPSRNPASQGLSSRRGHASSGLQLAKDAPTLHPISHSSTPANSQIRRPNTTVPGSGISRAAWNGGPAANTNSANTNSAPDYFADPFSDGVPAASLNLPTTSSTAVQPGSPVPPQTRHSGNMPLELRPANGLRTNIAQLQLPAADPPVPVTPTVPPTDPKSSVPEASVPESSVPDTAPSTPLQLAPAKPKPAPILPQQTPQTEAPAVPTLPSALPPAAKPTQTKPKSSLGTILKQNRPFSQGTKPSQGTEPAPPASDTAPSLQGGTPPPAPAFRDQLRNADQTDRDRLNSGKGVKQGFGVGGDVLEDLPFSCEDFRKRIASQTIDQVSLDISPPYRPDEMDEKRYQGLKERFDEKQSIRTWHDRNGNALLTGRLNDLAYEKAVIETNDGSKDALPINQLSEGDIAYIAENWGLPKECLIEQVSYTPRQWTASTMTWKASNLCHHPLYFEDVNLERYGHTRGPLVEPFVQSAHFFGNILVLPYKMGVHCPSECQYALGYYRPGNCSPWIKPPVPISARGAIAQAATMTGMFWLIP